MAKDPKKSAEENEAAEAAAAELAEKKEILKPIFKILLDEEIEERNKVSGGKKKGENHWADVLFGKVES